LQKITLGADVQKWGIYYVIRGWGYNTESWLLDADYLAGQTEHDPVWLALRSVIDAPIADRPIDRVFIDSGYRPGEAIVRPDHAVYTFCRTLPGLAYPTKGRDTLDKPFYFSAIDYTVGGSVVRGGVKLCHINTDFFKRWIHARIKWPEGAPGGWHLHNQTTEDYARQLVAEELVTRASSGRMVWVIRSKDNHFFDCEVNATCAAWSINVHKLPQLSEETTIESSRGNQVSAAPPGYDRRTIG
jgi:phage terminase large subunit GpA-like protein